jgi:hypothetical protein
MSAYDGFTLNADEASDLLVGLGSSRSDAECDLGKAHDKGFVTRPVGRWLVQIDHGPDAYQFSVTVRGTRDVDANTASTDQRLRKLLSATHNK